MAEGFGFFLMVLVGQAVVASMLRRVLGAPQRTHALPQFDCRAPRTREGVAFAYDGTLVPAEPVSQFAEGDANEVAR
jgi:hypothetical protein